MKNTLFPSLKSKKFWMVLPLVLIPLASLFYWCHSLAKDRPSIAQKADALLKGLPDPQLDQQKGFDKWNYYQSVQEDSAKKSHLDQQAMAMGAPISNYPTHKQMDTYDPEAQETEIYQKLQQLHELVQSPSKKQHPSKTLQTGTAPPQSSDTLQHLLGQIDQGEEDQDPQLQQIDGLLQKILAIQHPTQYANAIAPSQPKDLYEALPAIVAGKQKVREGGVVKMKLLDSALINQHWIPKGQWLFGTCQVVNHRMQIKVQSILLGQSILPVDLVVFDQHDGMIGIQLPDGQLNEAWRNGSDQAIQSLSVLPYDSSPEVQIAGAGLSAAKSLFSKKVKRIQFKLHDGYPLLLRDNQKLSNSPFNY